MRNLQTYEQWLSLNEGGWASAKTQSTTLTPALIAEIVKIVDRLGEEFNSHLRELDLPSLDFLRPIGSGTWWKEDMEKNPDKTYGDVDFMLAYPTLKLSAKSQRQDEIDTIKLYNKEFLMWMTAEKPEHVDVEETKRISSDSSLKLMIELPFQGETAYIQIDLVTTHKEYTEWALFRFTPEKGVKGFTIGKLYSALGEVLQISIQSRGVRAKFQKDLMVQLSKRAGTEERLISANVNTFIHDIAKFFWEEAKGDKPYQPSPSLQQWKGLSPSGPTFEGLCDGIRALAETLEGLGEFGTVIKFRSAKDFLKAVVDEYESIMMVTYNASKFNKAATPAAFAAIEKTRSLIKEYIQKTEDLLLKK